MVDRRAPTARDCSTLRSLLVAGLLLSLAWPLPTAAQQLLFHFPLDGSPAVRGSESMQARLYVQAGGVAPTTVPGRFGEAAYFHGASTIAMPFNLDPDTYPDITVTAWVKLDAGSQGDRTVFSAGNGNVPKLKIYGNRSQYIAARGSLTFDTAIPVDEWVFIAGVIDMANARIRIHQRDRERILDNVSKLNLYPPSKYRNPDDPSLESMAYVFVGSHGFGQWHAKQMAIDDVRVYAGILSAEQIDALRNATTAETGSAMGGGSSGTPAFQGSVLTDENVEELQQARDASAAPDITYASEEEAQAAAERRERESAVDVEEPASAGTPYPVGEPGFSAIAGYRGQNQRTLDLSDRFLHNITWDETQDAPCVIGIGSGEDPDGEEFIEEMADVGCSSGFNLFLLFKSLNRHTVSLSPSVIGSISVCSTGASNRRLKGIRVSGDRIRDDGTTVYEPAADESYKQNCETWSSMQLCPVNPNHYATGVIIHSNPRNARDQEEIVGLQLICRRIGMR